MRIKSEGRVADYTRVEILNNWDGYHLAGFDMLGVGVWFERFDKFEDADAILKIILRDGGYNFENEIVSLNKSKSEAKLEYTITKIQMDLFNQLTENLYKLGVNLPLVVKDEDNAEDLNLKDCEKAVEIERYIFKDGRMRYLAKKQSLQNKLKRCRSKISCRTGSGEVLAYLQEEQDILTELNEMYDVKFDELDDVR